MNLAGESVALLGLGANIGEPRSQLREAVKQLGMIVDVSAVSSVYHSEPVGETDQPRFLNLVCRVHTALTPAALLALTQAVEQRLGRTRQRKNEPRLIDIDLLTYDDLVMDTPELTLPHPRMDRRAFVLHPLAEVAPGWRHPVSGLSAREMIEAAGPLEAVELAGKLDR